MTVLPPHPSTPLGEVRMLARLTLAAQGELIWGSHSAVEGPPGAAGALPPAWG